MIAILYNYSLPSPCTAASFLYCGNMPTVINPSTVNWARGSGSFVDHASLEIRKADNIWSQTATGCLSTEQVVSDSHVSSSSSRSVPNVDYDSLYIARVLWLDSSNNPYYHVNSECYFIPRRSECLQNQEHPLMHAVYIEVHPCMDFITALLYVSHQILYCLHHAL